MLKELIDDFYLDQQQNKEQTRFYITDAGKCPRAVFFKFKKVPMEKVDARLLRIYEHGEAIHRNIFNVLYRLRVGVTTEVKIPETEIVSGRADALLTIDGHNYVLDIKSMNSMIFRKLKEPKEENVLQIQLYMHYFCLKKGILLYIDKDRQEMKEFVIKYNKKLCEKLLKDFSALKEKVDQNVIPNQLEDCPKNWQCRFCQFREICAITGKGDVEWPEFRKLIESQVQRLGI